MHMFEEGFCYSPLLPWSYGGHTVGHWGNCAGDLQLWNLMWLSLPSIDKYLDHTTDPATIWKEIPYRETGSIIATLRGPNCQKIFTDLRGVLKRNPQQFVRWIYMHKHLENFPPYHIIPNWLTTVEARALEANGNLSVKSEMDSMFQRFKAKE